MAILSVSRDYFGSSFVGIKSLFVCHLQRGVICCKSFLIHLFVFEADRFKAIISNSPEDV